MDKLRIGLRGCFAPRWQTAFPDDLPVEWRLSYLANEFDAVWLSLADIECSGLARDTFVEEFEDLRDDGADWQDEFQLLLDSDLADQPWLDELNFADGVSALRDPGPCWTPDGDAVGRGVGVVPASGEVQAAELRQLLESFVGQVPGEVGILLFDFAQTDDDPVGAAAAVAWAQQAKVLRDLIGW